MTADPTLQKKLLKRMMVADAALMLLGLAFAVGHFSFDVPWMLYAFIAAIAAGFAVQIWFVMRIKRGA